MDLYVRVVDDLKFLSFLKGKVILGASVIVVQSYEQSDSTTCTRYKHRVVITCTKLTSSLNALASTVGLPQSLLLYLVVE